MEHKRVHDNLQALNRTLEELKDYAHTYTFRGTIPHGWQNRIIKRKLDNLQKYLKTLREIELGNTIPEVGQTIDRVNNVLDKIEQDAQVRERSPTDPDVLTDEPPVKTYVYSTRDNLDGIRRVSELNPKEIAKNVYGARHRSPGREGEKRTKRTRKHKKKSRKPRRKKRKTAKN